MARQVLPIVGAIVGGFFGSPQLGFALGSILGQLVDPATSQGPKLGELPVQTSLEGQPRAIIYGVSTCTGYILDFAAPIKTWESVDSGGKGSQENEPNTIYRSFAIAICEGPIQALLRVWENDKLVYDIRPGSLMAAESAKWLSNKFVYFGDEDQTPNIFMEQTISGVGTTPAYRGTAYFYANLEDLTETAGAIKQYRFEVAGSASLTVFLNPLIVYPWVQSTIDPRDSRNEHTYQYKGFTYQVGNPQPYPYSGTPVRDSESEALSDLRDGWNLSGVVTPPAVDAIHLIGNSAPPAGTDVSTMFPPFGNIAVEQQSILLHYNEAIPTSYTLPADYPIASSLLPEFPSGAWGASSPRASVFYLSEASSLEGQFQNPLRNYSTEAYTNTIVPSGKEVYFTYDGLINTIRVPVAPEGFTKVTGTAKQLAAVEYRSSNLYQNGVGPVLLPGDPDYDNATFWADAKAAAVAAGTMHSDVASPVVVSAYATGFNVGLGDPIPLSGIVADLCDRSTLVADDDFDVSELTDLVKGLTLTGDYTAGDAIDTLRSCYFFDKAEPGDKIYFPKRGKPVVMTLDFDDLVDVPDLSKREQVGEVPKKLHLMYQNPTAGYAPVKATFERSSIDVQSAAETTMQVPVVLDVDEARQMVHKQMKVMVAEAQGEIKLTIPERLISLIPSDNIGLSLRGQVRRLRIDENEWADGIMSQTLRVDRQSAYTSNLTGIAIPEPTLPPSTIVGETTFIFADVPSRSDTEDDLHYLVAGVGALPGWYGWQMQRSYDAGANYTNVEQFSQADVMGSLVDAVPAASEHFTDTTNTVRVQLYNSNHTLEDLTDQQFLSEGGAFLLENADGSYEVMQYRDATDEGDGIFALTTLHRGRLNSGAYAHSAGARFVLLTSAHHIPAQSAWIGQALTHRPVSLGESPEAAAEQTDTYVGRSQLEWAPASLVLARSVANVVTGSWAPRHRFGTDDAPIASINFQGYRITIVGSSTVTFDQTSNLLSYDASALGASVVVSVQALNRITGAGPATSGTI